MDDGSALRFVEGERLDGRLLIDGVWRTADAKDRLEVFNPSSGALLGWAPAGG